MFWVVINIIFVSIMIAVVINRAQYLNGWFTDIVDWILFVLSVILCLFSILSLIDITTGGAVVCLYN